MFQLSSASDQGCQIWPEVRPDSHEIGLILEFNDQFFQNILARNKTYNVKFVNTYNYPFNPTICDKIAVVRSAFGGILIQCCQIGLFTVFFLRKKTVFTYFNAALFYTLAITLVKLHVNNCCLSGFFFSFSAHFVCFFQDFVPTGQLPFCLNRQIRPPHPSYLSSCNCNSNTGISSLLGPNTLQIWHSK